MAQHSAFFYGTLMAPAVLHRVCHGTSQPEKWQSNLLTIKPAMLYSHRRHRVKNADYPAVIPSEDADACVRGTYVTGLTEGDIWRLDIFEGDEYSRRPVEVKTLAEKDGQLIEEGETVKCETYIWIAGENELDLVEWDFDEFVRDKMKRWVGAEGNPEYAEVDDAVKSQQTDPTRGRGLNGSITQSLAEHNAKSEDILKNAV